MVAVIIIFCRLSVHMKNFLVTEEKICFCNTKANIVSFNI